MDHNFPFGFHHQEIKSLYEHDLNISHEIVKQILALPRQTLIEDLEKVLKDTIDRSGLFQKQDLDNNQLAFHLHALWLLADLKATEALPTVLDVLKQDSDFHDFWFSGFLTENFWESVFHIVGNQLEILKEVVFHPTADWAARDVPSTVVAQIALYHPARRQESIDWFQSVFEKFESLDADDPIIDIDVIGALIANSIVLHEPSLLPSIQILYAQKKVNEELIGDYQSVENDLISDKSIRWDRQRLHQTAYERYEYAMKHWYYLQKRYDEDFELKEEKARKRAQQSLLSRLQKPLMSTQKVGRNEPCPCGSGKKYKKCCWNT